MPELRVKTTTMKSCFVNIPLRWANILWDETCPNLAIKVTFKHLGKLVTKYLGWTGGCSNPINGQETLEIDHLFAKSLGIKDGQNVDF